MLRRFLYLDSAALSEYVTAMEGGLTTAATKRLMQSGTGTAGVDAKFARASGEKSREEEESRTFSDTDQARFDRLIQAARAEPEKLGWIDVLQPDTDLDGIGIGAMVSWECDLYIPELIQAMARSGEALGAISMMQKVLPQARNLGLNTEGLPSDAEMKAAEGFLVGIDANLIVVGEDEETDWRVAGQLLHDSLKGDIEGRAILVGKVSSKIPAERWKPFLTFPGMKLVSREERRRLERQPPAPGKEDEYLGGPALVLDILAIYR